jgi:hypothetical protein
LSRVSTANTPGIASALRESMRFIFACANGLRSTLPYSMPGNFKSPA